MATAVQAQVRGHAPEAAAGQPTAGAHPHFPGPLSVHLPHNPGEQTTRKQKDLKYLT